MNKTIAQCLIIIMVVLAMEVDNFWLRMMPMFAVFWMFDHFFEYKE